MVRCNKGIISSPFLRFWEIFYITVLCYPYKQSLLTLWYTCESTCVHITAFKWCYLQRKTVLYWPLCVHMDISLQERDRVCFCTSQSQYKDPQYCFCTFNIMSYVLSGKITEVKYCQMILCYTWAVQILGPWWLFGRRRKVDIEPYSSSQLTLEIPLHTWPRMSLFLQIATSKSFWIILSTFLSKASGIAKCTRLEYFKVWNQDYRDELPGISYCVQCTNDWGLTGQERRATPSRGTACFENFRLFA